MHVKNMIFSFGMGSMLLFGGLTVQATEQLETRTPMQQLEKCPHTPMALMVGEKIMEVLKMDVKTFHAELEKGKSILQIAKEKGVKKQELIDVIVKEMSNKVDEQVKAGNMTKEKAIWIKKYLPVRAEMWITKPGHKCLKNDIHKNQRQEMVE